MQCVSKMRLCFLSQCTILCRGIESDIIVETAKCLCRPICPPSGVSTGSIKPHWDECNSLGATTLAVGSMGRLIFLQWDKAELNDNRLRSWTIPSFVVYSFEPHWPLNAFLNPIWTENPDSKKKVL